MRASLTEHCRGVDSIEGVAKIQFEKDFIRMAGVAVQPVPSGMDGGLGAGGHPDSKLQGPQVVPGLLPDRLAQQLIYQVTEYFPNSNGPYPPARLGEGVQGAARKVGCKGRRGLSPGKEVAKGSQVQGNLITMRGEQSFSEMVCPEAGWPRRGPTLEATNGLGLKR